MFPERPRSLAAHCLGAGVRSLVTLLPLRSARVSSEGEEQARSHTHVSAPLFLHKAEEAVKEGVVQGMRAIQIRATSRHESSTSGLRFLS